MSEIGVALDGVSVHVKGEGFRTAVIPVRHYVPRVPGRTHLGDRVPLLTAGMAEDDAQRMLAIDAGETP